MTARKLLRRGIEENASIESLTPKERAQTDALLLAAAKREAEAVSDAIALLTERALHPETKPASWKRLFSEGGVVTATEDELVQALLDLTNESELLHSLKFGPDESGGTWGRDRVATMMAVLSAGPNQKLALELIESLSDVQLKGSVAYIPVEGDEGGVVLRAVIAGGESVKWYAMQILVDKSRAFLSQFRRCQLTTCERFFLDRDIRPGTRRSYCSAACSEKAESDKAKARAWKSRRNPKRKKARKGRS